MEKHIDCCDPRYFLQVKVESGPKEGPDDEAIEVYGRQIIAVLREQEAGLSITKACHKHGISTATFYCWKAKFGGMEVSEAKRLKQLDDENAKLKRLLADEMLDNVAPKDLTTKKSEARREARGCRPIVSAYEMTERRACRLIKADHETVRYRSRRPRDDALRGRLRELAAEQRRFGYRRLHILLRAEGQVLNRKKTQRLCREEGLTLRKRATGTRALILVEARPNARWSVDFVHDQLSNGRRFRRSATSHRRLRGSLYRNGRSAPQSGPAAPIARCSTGPLAPVSTHDSSVDWMNAWGHSRWSPTMAKPNLFF